MLGLTPLRALTIFNWTEVVELYSSYWRMLGTRSMSEARAWMLSVMRQQVGFAAAIAHARLRLSRLERIGHSGRTAGRSGAVTAPFLSQTMWERHGRGPLGGGGGRAGAMGPGLFE